MNTFAEPLESTVKMNKREGHLDTKCRRLNGADRRFTLSRNASNPGQLFGLRTLLSIGDLPQYRCDDGTSDPSSDELKQRVHEGQP